MAAVCSQEIVVASIGSEQKSLKGRKRDELFSIMEDEQGDNDMNLETRRLWDLYVRGSCDVDARDATSG
jgi:hypothetical protein